MMSSIEDEIEDKDINIKPLTTKRIKNNERIGDGSLAKY